MTLKLSEKARKASAAKRALRRRIADIASGARGADFDAENETLTIADLPRFLAGLKERFPALAEDRLRHVTGDWRLDEFETLDEATEHLWEHGIRA